MYPAVSPGRQVQIQEFGKPMEGYDPERGQSTSTLPGSGASTPGGARRRSHLPRNSSWDLLAGIRTEYEEFDTRKASEAHLAFAQGDIPNNKVRVTCWLICQSNDMVLVRSRGFTTSC